MLKEKGIEVELLKPFPIVIETLGRIGIKNARTKKMYPSCYVYEKNERYYLVHFKEMLLRPNLCEDDYTRRNTIIWMLMKWKLIDVLSDEDVRMISTNMSPNEISVLSTKMVNEEDWEICHKLQQFGLNQYKNLEEEGEESV